MDIRIFSEPTAELFTLSECYDQLRVDPIDYDSDNVGSRPDDSYIMSLQTAARVLAEDFTGLSIAAKVYELSFESFPSPLVLPYPPFVSLLGISIDDGLSQNDIDTTEYTVTTDERSNTATVTPVTSWPALETGSIVRVHFKSGYATADDISDLQIAPATIGMAIKLAMSYWYSNREGEKLPEGVKCLLRPHRILRGMA